MASDDEPDLDVATEAPPFEAEGSDLAGPGPEGRSRKDEILEGIEESMPFIFFGAACFALSYMFWGHYAVVGQSHYPLWLVFLIVGGITTTGGLAAAVVPEEDEERPNGASEDVVTVPREKWESMVTEAEYLRKRDRDLREEEMGDDGPTGEVREAEEPVAEPSVPQALEPDLSEDPPKPEASESPGADVERPAEWDESPPARKKQKSRRAQKK